MQCIPVLKRKIWTLGAVKKTGEDQRRMMTSGNLKVGPICIICTPTYIHMCTHHTFTDGFDVLKYVHIHRSSKVDEGICGQHVSDEEEFQEAIV